MTEGYITVRDIVNLGKRYITQLDKAGFTKSVTECQTFDATLDDGRYVVAIHKIASIKIHDNDKQMVLWYKPDYAELYNVYVGGWYDEKEKLYEIEQVVIYNDIDDAINVAGHNKQEYIYDLKENKCINVNTYFILERLKRELESIDDTLKSLRWVWAMQKNGHLADDLIKAYEWVMVTRKQIARRIVLLQNQV